MKNLTIAIAFTFLLSGCLTVTEVTGPSGKRAYALNCNDDVAGCYKKAGELCPNGYVVPQQVTGTVAVPIGRSIAMGSDTTMLVECKSPQ